MLDIKLIREQPQKIKEGIAKKGVKPELVDKFLKIDLEWRRITRDLNRLKKEHNILSKQRKIGEAKKLKERESVLKNKLRELEKERENILIRLPNIPFDKVPVGKSEEDNVILYEKCNKFSFDFPPKNYFDIARDLDLIDTEKAGFVSGTRFAYLKKEAVLLEFALINFVLSKLLEEGFEPIIPPVLVRPEIMYMMGKFKFLEDNEAFLIEKDRLYLVGSAEHSIGPYHAGEVLKKEELPKRYIGFSTCFRREAGSYGKDTRGVLRVHQFDKLEMFSFALPSKSEKEHRYLLSLQEYFVSELGLPYRVVEICTGDMTWADARQFDIEVWFPYEGRYRETHSASNTTDYQSRGLNVKYRTSEGKSEFLHMLNATALAIPRILAAILENYQMKDGRVSIPKVLVKYVGKKFIG